MATVRVFVSFEYDKDKELHGSFFGQGKDNSCYALRDYSLQEAYHPAEDWVEKAENQIRKSDIVIVIVRQDTHNAPGVLEEVRIANELGKPIFQLIPQDGNYGRVCGAGELIEWKWKEIDGMIEKLLF